MTHPTQESGVGGADTTVTVPASIEDRFSAILTEEQPQEDEAGEDDAQPEAEAPEAGEDGGEEAAEPDEPEGEAEDDLPPIAAPNSFTDEEKAEFASLPRPMQEALARREADRDRAFHAKTQEASRAKSEAEKSVLTKTAEIQHQSLTQLGEIATLLMPAQPDERLLYGNQDQVNEYHRQNAIYERALTQLNQAVGGLQQRIQATTAELQQKEAAEFRQILSEQFPEYLDPSQSAKHQAELASIARELGYSDDLIASAAATDILAMRKVADLKAKADKWDALQKKKMEGVRAAKALPKVARPGTALPKGHAANERYQADRQAMKNGDTEAAKRVFSQFL
jgi:hypothetical protein